MFRNAEESHQHSLQTLNQLYEYDDFMGSVQTMVDLGCGTGLDLEWWATRYTRDDKPKPLNIRCTGVDVLTGSVMPRRYPNVNYQSVDFEQSLHTPKGLKFDVLWSHDSFQYCINPIDTLVKWRSIASKNAMLVLILPQTMNIKQRQLEITQHDNVYYHYSLVNLVHMLAIAGWDCANGFFKKDITDPWLHLIVYNSDHGYMNPKTARWVELAEKNLLPESFVQSINRHGYVCQEDLVLTWIDKSVTWLGKQ